MSSLSELYCADCNTQFGWISYSGPIGVVYCVECGEVEQEAENE